MTDEEIHAFIRYTGVGMGMAYMAAEIDLTRIIEKSVNEGLIADEIIALIDDLYTTYGDKSDEYLSWVKDLSNVQDPKGD